MTIPGSRENAGRRLSTADLASAARGREVVEDEEQTELDEKAAPSATAGEMAIEDVDPAGLPNRSPPPPGVGRSAGMKRAADIEDADIDDVQRESAARAPRVNDGGSKAAPSAPTSSDTTRSADSLVALFTPELTETYRTRWLAIQSGFVDDPRQAVRSGDELVAEIMTNLANTFADERHRVEGQLDATGEGTTEDLRVALRRYRSFFERLLSL